jgi:hypothetical protein
LRPEAEQRDRFLAAVGTLPGVLVHRCEPMRNAYHVRALPDGFPDVLFAAGGRIYLLEWKAKRGRLESSQEVYHRQMLAAGVRVLVPRNAAQCCRDLAAIVGGDVGRLLVKAAESLAV